MEVTAAAAAVAAVMIEDGIHDGILAQIFDYVAIPSGRTDEDALDEEILVPGTTQDEIINLTLVSKRFYQLISTFEENGSKKWNNIIPVLEMRPPSQSQPGDSLRLLNNIRDHGLDADGTVIEKFREHRHMVVYDIHKIQCNVKTWNEITELAKNIQLPGIISLTFAPPSTPSIGSFIVRNDIDHLIFCIVTMLPNLLEINMSNISDEIISGDGHDFVFMNDSFEKIRWNNINCSTQLRLDGFQMEELDNLRQLVMDNSIFICYKDRDARIELGIAELCGILDFETIENDPDNMNDDNDDIDNNNINNGFLFQYCCQNLVRLSIRNAKYIEEPIYGNNDDASDPSRIAKCLTQNALIKFVRHAPPTLQWFRSDLSPDNIRLLQSEFPTIEFLN